MNGRIIRDIRAGRRLPKALELEAGFPFYWDSIRADMCIWVERMLRRKAEEPEPSWNHPGYLIAFRSLRDGARDPCTADEHLVGLVLQVADALPPWGLTDHRRCQVYLSRLRSHPLPTDEESRQRPGGSADLNAGTGADRQAAPVEADSLNRHPNFITPQASDRPGRMKDILAGKAWPEAIELLYGMPFFKGNLYEDMRHYAGRLLGGIEWDAYIRDDGDEYDRYLIPHAQRLRKATGSEASTQLDCGPIVERLLYTFPTGYHEGRLRCSYYRATLGVKGAKVDIAGTAVSLALRSAKVGPPSESDYQLIATALGWLAEVAIDEPPLAGQLKPVRCEALEDTARHYGQMLVDFMRMPPTRSGP